MHDNLREIISGKSAIKEIETKAHFDGGWKLPLIVSEVFIHLICHTILN
jgi:hypothetical protein